MTWNAYLAILQRRWILLAVILVVDLGVSGLSYRQSARSVGFNGCLTLYVADVSSPSLISAPPNTLQNEGQLLAGETAANFFADDILDVAQSSRVATFVSNALAARNLPSSNFDSVNGHVSGDRRDRTVNLCVQNPSAQTALLAAQQVGTAMTAARAQFVGRQIARRTYVAVISPAGVTAATRSHQLLNLALRLILGGLIGLGVTLVWDALDPRVRDQDDLYRTLEVPVLAVVP